MLVRRKSPQYHDRGEEIRKCDDFVGEYGRGAIRSQRYDFCRQVWGGVHSYMADQIQFLGQRAHRDVLDKMNLSFELCIDEVGTQLNSLRDVQGGRGTSWGGEPFVELCVRYLRENAITGAIYALLRFRQIPYPTSCSQEMRQVATCEPPRNHSYGGVIY